MKNVAMGVLLAVAGGVACSSPVESETEPSPGLDVVVAPPSDWSCIGAGTLPPPRDEYREEVEYVFPLVDESTKGPIPGWTVDVCNRADLVCAVPLSHTAGMAGDGREITVKVPVGGNVFLRLQAPGYIPVFLMFDGRLLTDQLGSAIEMFTPTALLSMAVEMQVPLDVSRGLLVVRGYDCQGRRATGASYALDAPSGTSTIPYAFADGRYTVTAPAGGNGSPSMTRLSGDRFLNVPLETVTAHGFQADDGREFGTAVAQVYPGAIANLEIRALQWF